LIICGIKYKIKSRWLFIETLQEGCKNAFRRAETLTNHNGESGIYLLNEGGVRSAPQKGDNTFIGQNKVEFVVIITYQSDINKPPRKWKLKGSFFKQLCEFM
jgi:hypothetical protein